MADWGQVLEASGPGRSERQQGKGTLAGAGTPVDIIATPGAGSRLLVKTVVIAKPSGAAESIITISDSTTDYADIDTPAGPYNTTVTFDPPIFFNANLAARAETSIAQTVRIFMTGWKERIA